MGHPRTEPALLEAVAHLHAYPSHTAGTCKHGTRRTEPALLEAVAHLHAYPSHAAGTCKYGTRHGTRHRPLPYGRGSDLLGAVLIFWERL